MTVYSDRKQKIQDLKAVPKVQKMATRIKPLPKFHQQLKAEMDRAGISVLEICAATGISFDTMTRYRSAAHAMEPTRGKLLLMRDAIGCPLSRLTTGPTPDFHDKRVNRKK